MTNSFGLYVHIPFCVHRCSYCDFFSFTQYSEVDFRALTDSLLREIRQAAHWLSQEKQHDKPLTSIFFGGGTPSLLPVPLLAQIFAEIQKQFGFAEGIEVTLEANPETVRDSFSLALKSATPVNRLSLGAQSFKPQFLRALERIGKKQSIIAAVESLGRSGFSNFSLDLIFGIPGQTEADLIDDIEAAAGLEPKHLSFYNLTLKPGHKLFSELPSDDAAAALYETGIRRLAELGYAQYEISNFAKVGFESRHNLVYWDGGDFLGVGPSAASRFFWNDRFHHRKQLSDYKGYLGQSTFPAVDFTPSTLGQTLLEAVFLEMRKNRGISLENFQTRYGYDLTRARKYPAFVRGNLVRRDEDRLYLSDTGRMLADGVTRDLVDWDPDFDGVLSVAGER